MIIRAIKAALHTRDFIYMGGAEKQGLKTLTNYKPKTWEELSSYLEGCVNLLMTEIKTGSMYLDSCVEVVEDDFNSLCIFGAASIILPCFDEVAKIKSNDWDVMIDNLHLLKVQKVNPLSTKLAEEIDNRIVLLTKTDFVSRFHYVSKKHRWAHHVAMETQLKEDAVKYKDLAEELVENQLYDVELLTKLFLLDNIIVEPFGARIAEIIPQEEEKVFFENALQALSQKSILGYTIVNQFLRTVDEGYCSYG